MNYLILTIIFIIITWIINKKTFYWETIVKFLWKQVYKKSDEMAYWINMSTKKKEPKEDYDELIKSYKKELSVSGNLINAILDYINNAKKEDDDEKESYKYERFDFEKLLNIAKSNPNVFKKINN